MKRLSPTQETGDLDALREAVKDEFADYVVAGDRDWTYSALWLVNKQDNLILALERELARLQTENTAQQQAREAALTAALAPFALTDDERYELQSFGDDELVFLRPDDDNDSVKNGWRKTVTIGDLRRCSHDKQ